MKKMRTKMSADGSRAFEVSTRIPGFPRCPWPLIPCFFLWAWSHWQVFCHIDLGSQAAGLFLLTGQQSFDQPIHEP